MMAANTKPTTVATSMESSSTGSYRPPNVRMLQNFHLIWLDGSIDEINNDEYRNSIIKLQQVINTVNTFTDADRCMDFITDNQKEKIFMIISGTFSQIIVPMAQEISHVSAIYIFCEHKMHHEKWAKEYSKINGVYTDITSICEELKQAAQHCDQNSISISFVKRTDTSSNQNIDQLDQSFMNTQLLKEILLTIDFEQVHTNEFLTYCREQFVGNTAELKNVDKIEKEYHHHQPIWWYTYQCFLYSMLNRALRLMEIDLIIKMGFFVQDLHKHIAALHAEQYGEQNHLNHFIVYRGQGLSQADFDQLKKTQGGLLAFNNFLSTSKSYDVSLRFVRRTIATSDLVGVLFVMKIDPSISATPFANVRNVSSFKGEEEILFSMHSVFRIGQAKQIDQNDRLWQADLTLTSENDPQLHTLTERMREETKESTGWYRLGILLIKLGQFNKAEELYEILLKQTIDESEKATIFSLLGGITQQQGKYAEAITIYEKVLDILQKTLPADHPSLANSYNNIGGINNQVGEYSKALSYYEKGLKILQKMVSPHHPDLATSYNNLGLVYRNMGDISKALSYYNKALEILQNTLPANHPDLASSYNNIGLVYGKMGEYAKALSYYEKALEIFQKTLPANHPSLANSYNSIGGMKNEMGEYSKALSYHEKSLEILQKMVSPHHPALATSYNNIGGVNKNMGDYSKALSYYEKALEIEQKTLPANHPILASSYNNVGEVYNELGEYSKALSYHEKALEIEQRTLPANHPSLAISYNNIGMVYNTTGEYLKALAYYEKALEICQKTLPANHPHLASSYSNISQIYYKIGDYFSAYSFIQRAVDIGQHSLPASHPLLQQYRLGLEIVKRKL